MKIELIKQDYDNILEALNQMIFRCTRNRNVLNDILLSSGDLDDTIEMKLLKEDLQKYRITLHKLEQLQLCGSHLNCFGEND